MEERVVQLEYRKVMLDRIEQVENALEGGNGNRASYLIGMIRGMLMMEIAELREIVKGEG